MKVDFKGYYNSVFCFSQEELRLLRNNADKAKYDHRGSKATLDFGDFKLIQYHMGYDNHRYFISVDSHDKEFEISPTQYNTVQNIFMKFYHEYSVINGSLKLIRLVKRLVDGNIILRKKINQLKIMHKNRELNRLPFSLA